MPDGGIVSGRVLSMTRPVYDAWNRGGELRIEFFEVDGRKLYLEDLLARNRCMGFDKNAEVYPPAINCYAVGYTVWDEWLFEADFERCDYDAPRLRRWYREDEE